VYPYRAIDQFGQVIDVLAAQKRDLAAARRFFAHALEQAPRPSEVSTDRAPAYLRCSMRSCRASCISSSSMRIIPARPAERPRVADGVPALPTRTLVKGAPLQLHRAQLPRTRARPGRPLAPPSRWRHPQRRAPQPGQQAATTCSWTARTLSRQCQSLDMCRIHLICPVLPPRSVFTGFRFLREVIAAVIAVCVTAFRRSRLAFVLGTEATSCHTADRASSAQADGSALIVLRSWC
jgi:DDE superfamily endonuclease